MATLVCPFLKLSSSSLLLPVLSAAVTNDTVTSSLSNIASLHTEKGREGMTILLMGTIIYTHGLDYNSYINFLIANNLSQE